MCPVEIDDNVPQIMNESKWLSHLLGIGTALEVPVGRGLLVVPSPFASLLLGAPLSGAGLSGALIARNRNR